jgi:cell shape-determining protein MreC
MKKTLLFLLVAAWMVSFVACGEKKKVEEAPVTTDVVAETPAAPVEEVKIAPADALKAFSQYAKEYGEAFNNLSKDPQKYTTLALQVNKQLEEIAKYKGDFTPKELKEYERSLKIIKDVSAGGTKPKK